MYGKKKPMAKKKVKKKVKKVKKSKRRGSMTLIKQEFQKHIKKINNNDFIYKHKIAFYLLSEQQFKLYEEGFKKGFELAHNSCQNNYHLYHHGKNTVY
jgi:hypothetical protein